MCLLLPLQLSVIGLSRNRLVGTLPEIWSSLTNVSHCHTAHLLIDDVVRVHVLHGQLKRVRTCTLYPMTGMLSLPLIKRG